MKNTKAQPLVSVVMATYNMAQYLELAVDSLLNQEWKNLEVIIVNDGSTDNTTDVLSAYDNDIRVRYFTTENQGQTKAKNLGIKHANGEFIGFCDADDQWEPYKLTAQMPLFESPQVGIVYSDAKCIDEHGTPLPNEPSKPLPSGNLTNKLLIENLIPFGTSVIRKACVDKSGCFDEQYRMGIDWDLWLRYSLDWEFAYSPVQTYIYRVWTGQMSNNHRGRYDFAFKILTNFVNNHKDRLSPRAVKMAWADMHIKKGAIYARKEGLTLMPIKSIARGLMLDPCNRFGWKTLAKIIFKLQKPEAAR